jgi:hypothetical protein
MLDVHVTDDGRAPMPNRPQFPAFCGTELTKAEHVLAFMLFDLAACLQPDTMPPAPPPVVIE